MPKQNSFVRFHSWQYQFKVPLVIYADFAAILHSSEEETNCDLLSSYMRDISHHIPSGFFPYASFAYGEVTYLLRLYRCKDWVEAFCNHIKEKAKRFYMFPQKPMKLLTLEQWREFGRARKCHICLESFEPWDRIVRDHFHYTGKCRGAGH